jgi:hypothetical protein
LARPLTSPPPVSKEDVLLAEGICHVLVEENAARLADGKRLLFRSSILIIKVIQSLCYLHALYMLKK